MAAAPSCVSALEPDPPSMRLPTGACCLVPGQALLNAFCEILGVALPHKSVEFEEAVNQPRRHARALHRLPRGFFSHIDVGIGVAQFFSQFGERIGKK